MRKNEPVLDRLPEFTSYDDNGCDLYPSCLSCPLPQCRYDDPGWIQREDRRRRDVAVIEATVRVRFLKGAVLYKVTALRNLFSFPGVELGLTSDEAAIDGRHLMLTISNGRFFGGAFPIAPSAELDDGLLDACAIGDTSPVGRAKLFRMAEKGRHVRSPHVHMRRSGRFTVRFERPPNYELDGEVWQAEGSDVVVEVVRRGLRIVVPA